MLEFFASQNVISNFSDLAQMKLPSAIIVPLLFLVPSSLSNLASNCTSTSAYRSYDGTCNNEENPDWGTTGQTFSLNDSPLGQITVEPIDNVTQGEDPVTEWLKEVLDFLLEDILDIEVSGKKATNSATPYLDLSNIYDPFTGKIFTCFSLNIHFFNLRQVAPLYLPVLPGDDIRAHQGGGHNSQHQTGLDCEEGV